MCTSLPRRVAVAAALLLVAAACGDDTTTDEEGASPDGDLACEERTSFHGDPGPDTVGEATPEKAIAQAAASYGEPTLARESGDHSTWNIHDDDGRLVGTIEIGPAPAGGFISGDHELCADLVDHGDEGEEGDTIVDSPAEEPKSVAVATNPLPDPSEWTWPGPPGEVVVHLLVDFSVGDGFEPVGIDVVVDGIEIVSGEGFHRPEEHCNYWGFYDMYLDPGEHTVEVRMSNGLELNEMFEVASESTAIANYTDPTWGDPARPPLGWEVHDGLIGCD